MIVLGVDAGIANVGFGVIDSSTMSVIVSGSLVTSPRTLQSRRVYSIARRIRHLIKATETDIVVAEDFIPFKRHKSMGHISQALGAILFVAEDSEARLVVVRPNVWPRQLMGLTQRAKYSKITTMHYVKKKLGIEARSEHEADALGMSLWYIKRHKEKLP